MANAREIQARINSVRDTMKITNAMYTISSSKVKQAKKKLEGTQPYYYALQGEISRILRHLPELEHRHFAQREQKTADLRTVGCIVVTSDTGMAGAYNHNVIKEAERLMDQYKSTKLFVVGEMGRQYFTRRNYPIDRNFRYTVQKPSMHRARVISGTVMDLFEKGDLDEVYLIFTEMVNAVSVETRRVKLLPLERGDFGTMKMPLNVHREEIALYPSAESVLDSIVPNYITGMIYACLVESYCSEQNSRMLAMQAATDSARDIIRELSILYNRARQAAITQELTEVISGARAQKRK